MRVGMAVIFSMALVILGGCTKIEQPAGKPVVTVPAVLTGTLRSEVLTVRFDDDGNGQSAVLTQDRLLDIAEALGLYTPATLKASAVAKHAATLLSLPLGVEVPVGVGNLFVILDGLTYDSANHTITLNIRFLVRDANGVVVKSQSVQIIMHGINTDEQGGVNVDSIEVVAVDSNGNQILNENLGEGDLDPVTTNTAPIAMAAAVPPQARAETVVILSAVGSADPDGDVLSYNWTQASGPAVTLSGANTSTASFLAPDITPDAVLQFTVTVSDGKATATATASVLVRHKNHPPIAKAGEAQTVTSGKPISLDGSASSDPDGDSITFAWTVRTKAPAVTLTGANTAKATCTAPEVTEDTILEFELTVSDSKLTASDVTRVVVKPAPPEGPVFASVSAPQSLIVSKAENVTLHCVVTDATGTVQSVTADLSSIDGGSQNLSGSNGDWTWSGTVTPRTIGLKTISFTAMDDAGKSATATATIDVTGIGGGGGGGGGTTTVSLLPYVPKDVTFLAAIRNAKDLADGVDEIVGVSSALADLLGMAQLDANSLDRGLAIMYRDRDFLTAALLEGSPAGLLQWIQNVGGEAITLSTSDAGDGVTCLTISPPGEGADTAGYGVNIYLGQTVDRKVVIIAATRQDVLSVLKAEQSILEQFDGSWLAAYNARQLVFYSDGTVLPFFAPVDTSSLLGALDLGDDSGDPSPNRLPDTDAICAIAGIGDPLAFTVWQRFAAGTPSLQKLQAQRVMTGSGLVGLPDEAIIVAGASSDSAIMAFDPLGAILGSFSWRSLADDETLPSPVDPILEALESMSALTRQESFCFSQLSGGSAGLIGYANIVEVSDDNPATDDASTYINLVNGLVSDVQEILEPTDGSLCIIQSTANTTYVPDRVVYQYRIDLKVLAKATDWTIADYQSQIEGVLGTEPLQINLVKIDPNHVALSMGGGPQRLSQIISNFQAGNAPLAEGQLLKHVAGLLPPSRTMEVYAALSQTNKLFYDIAKAIGIDLGGAGDPGNATSAIGASTSRDGNSMRGDVVIPSGSLYEAALLAELYYYYSYSLGNLLFVLLGGVAI